MPKQFFIRWRGGFEGRDSYDTANEFMRSVQRQLEPGTHVELYKFEGCWVVPNLLQPPFIEAANHED